VLRVVRSEISTRLETDFAFYELLMHEIIHPDGLESFQHHHERNRLGAETLYIMCIADWGKGI
jgi:hypothetical protein